jgi:hypothetical protein
LYTTTIFSYYSKQAHIYAISHDFFFSQFPLVRTLAIPEKGRTASVGDRPDWLGYQENVAKDDDDGDDGEVSEA